MVLMAGSEAGHWETARCVSPARYGIRADGESYSGSNSAGRGAAPSRFLWPGPRTSVSWVWYGLDSMASHRGRTLPYELPGPAIASLVFEQLRAYDNDLRRCADS